MHRRFARGGLAAVFAAFTLAACGGGSSPTGPSGGGGGGGTPGPVGATITITANGMNPSAATISVGQSITFVNNNTRTHNVSSDPHPAHTDCPPLTVGVLGPGQSRTTGAFTTARSCGFHDHDDPENRLWVGQVTIR